MSESRHFLRQKSNMSAKKSPSSNKKIRKPLKCKKNITHTSESRKKTLKKCKSEEKNMYCEINQKSQKKSLRSSPRLSLSQPENISISGKKMLKSLYPKFKALDSVEIDVLGNFTQSNKKISSSSRQSNKFQLAEVRNADKNISRPKSQRYKENLNELSAFISPFIQNKSPRRNKRQSFYRQSNLITQHCGNPNRKMSFNDIDSKMATPRTSEVPEDSQRSRNSMVLRSIEKDKRKSNDMLLSKGVGIKRFRKSITCPKNQLTENTKGIQRSSSKLGKASAKKNEEKDSVLNFIEEPKTVANCKSPEAVELFTNTGSSRSSMRLRTRHSLEKTMQKNKEIDSGSRGIQKPETDMNYKAPEAVELFTSSSRSSMTLQTRHSSEEPSRNRISLRARHHSEKASDKMPHTANIEQIKKHTAISKEQQKGNVKTRSKSTSSANQETEMLVHKHKRSDSGSKRSLKSEGNKCLNDKDYQTPKMTPPQSTRSSPRKSLRLVSSKKSEKTFNGDLRECYVNVSKVIKETQTKKSTVLPKKQKAPVKGKRNARKRLSSSPIKIETPFQKKRKLSVKFKKQTRPRSYSSAIIPIDSLALTPAIPRKTKSDGFKFHGRNTLKRKRFIMEEIKKADNGYEDDIYESRTFDHFKDMFPDSSDSSELSCNIKTPKFPSLLTPVIQCKTPAYKDCFSPTEYAMNRKIAEECIYRNRKRKSCSSKSSQVETPDVPEKKKLEFNKVVEEACAIQKEVEKLTEDSSDEEDLYFTDES